MKSETQITRTSPESRGKARIGALIRAGLVAGVFAAHSSARAEPIVIAVEAGQSPAEGIAEISANPLAEVTLELWVRADATFLGYSLSFATDPGLELRATHRTPPMTWTPDLEADSARPPEMDSIPSPH